MGLNIAASVFIAYLRPGLIRLLSPKSESEPGMLIGIKDFGFKWFFKYSNAQQRVVEKRNVWGRSIDTCSD